VEIKKAEKPEEKVKKRVTEGPKEGVCG